MPVSLEGFAEVCLVSVLVLQQNCNLVGRLMVVVVTFVVSMLFSVDRLNQASVVLYGYLL